MTFRRWTRATRVKIYRRLVHRWDIRIAKSLLYARTEVVGAFIELCEGFELSPAVIVCALFSVLAFLVFFLPETGAWPIKLFLGGILVAASLLVISCTILYAGPIAAALLPALAAWFLLRAQTFSQAIAWGLALMAGLVVGRIAIVRLNPRLARFYTSMLPVPTLIVVTYGTLAYAFRHVPSDRLRVLVDGSLELRDLIGRLEPWIGFGCILTLLLLMRLLWIAPALRADIWWKRISAGRSALRYLMVVVATVSTVGLTGPNILPVEGGVVALVPNQKPSASETLEVAPSPEPTYRLATPDPISWIEWHDMRLLSFTALPRPTTIADQELASSIVDELLDRLMHRLPRIRDQMIVDTLSSPYEAGMQRRVVAIIAHIENLRIPSVPRSAHRGRDKSAGKGVELRRALVAELLGLIPFPDFADSPLAASLGDPLVDEVQDAVSRRIVDDCYVAVLLERRDVSGSLRDRGTGAVLAALLESPRGRRMLSALQRALFVLAQRRLDALVAKQRNRVESPQDVSARDDVFVAKESLDVAPPVRPPKRVEFHGIP